MSLETLVSIFYGQAESQPDHPILMVKRDGEYREVTFRTLSERVRALAAGLKQLGVKSGDRVAIVSENRQEFIEANFAILTLGAISAPMHAPLSASQVKAQVNDCEPVALFLSTLAQRDKIEPIRKDMPSVKHLFAFDGEAVDGVEVESYDALLESGRKALAENPALLDDPIAAVKSEDIANLIYTSGTTGESKGAMLTHANLVSNVRMSEKLVPERLAGYKLVLAFLPQSHVFALTCDLYMGIAIARTLALAEGVEQLVHNIQEVKPHYFAAVPRVFEKMAGVARHMQSEGKEDALLQILGGRIRAVGSGGAALASDIAQFFFDNDIPIYQGYGLTETSPVISANSEGINRIGSAGKLLSPEIEVKIAEDGEILTRGPHVMKGYWNRPEATAEVIDADGWFHTGDVGKFDEDGFLLITDRKKDLIVTAYGKNIAPQQIEALLGFDPLVEQAVVYGDGKKYLTALIVPCEQVVMIAAERFGMGHLSYTELINLPMAHGLFQQRIDQALCNLASHEQIKKFIIIPEPFKYEEGHMTVTAKIRRKQIIEKYQIELEALYLEDI